MEKNSIKIEKYKNMYMNIAYEVAKMSYCKRLKVGAIAVKNGRIISMGWNGQPSGFCNECEDENNITYPTVLHAESNLLGKLAQSTDSSTGSEIYVTHSPCLDCAKIITQTGIIKVYYNVLYRSSDGIEHLIACGIPVEKL